MKNLNTINKIKSFVGVKFFQKRKPIKFIIFDVLYSIFFVNKKKLPDFINEFDKKGFVKIFPYFGNEIMKLTSNLVLAKPKSEKPPYNFEVNYEIKSITSNILKILDNDYLVHLKKYYNAEILPTYICLRRNTYYKKEDLKDEIYSDNFHNDAYLRTHFKIFLNLKDISEKHGPMRIVPKNKSKEFITATNYSNRMNYNEKNDKFSYLNTGKIGECLLFDPTSCFHRAGVPEENYHRDYMIITFVCVPRNDNLIKSLIKTDIFKYEDNPLLSLSKPRKFSQVFNQLFNFYKY
tara:strand:- start:226 stop:1101 length:876 start_codon:yes stop_codon:yes gene_type:complete